MKTSISNKVFEALKELRLNNNREWYQENKSLINDARKEVECFTQELIDGVRKFDNNIVAFDAKKVMYKQHRDTRFSKDKTPYKIHFASVLCYGGIKQNGVPCYYFHIEEGFVMLAIGVYCPEVHNLKKIRDEIYYNLKEFESIINDKEFKSYFESIDSQDKLKMAPKGYDKNWEGIEYLKNKHFTSTHYIPIDNAIKKGFIDYVLKVFKSSVAFNQFLQRAID